MPPPDAKAAVAKSVANQTRGQQINLNNASNTATIAKKKTFFSSYSTNYMLMASKQQLFKVRHT